jgi:hypothetical protein
VDVDGDEPNMIEFLRAKRRPFVVTPDGAEDISDDESVTLEGKVKPVVLQRQEETECVGAIIYSLDVLEKMNQNRKIVDAQNLEAMQEEIPIEAKKFDAADLADDAEKRINIQKILDEIEEMQARAPVGSKHLSSNMARDKIDLGDVQINSLCIGNNPYNQWMANQALGSLPIPITITEVLVPPDLPPHVPHPANYKKAETERQLIQVTNTEVANGMNPISGGAPAPTIFCRWPGTQFVTVEDKGNWLMIPNPAVEGVSMQHEPFLPQRSFEERVRNIHRKDIDNIHARSNIFEEAEDMEIRVNREYARRRQIDYAPEIHESTTFLRKQFLITATGKHVGDQNEYGEHHGQGTLSTPNGDFYMGMFSNGNINGHGKFTYKNGNKYLGDFEENWIQGTGELTINRDGQYQGDFWHGMLMGAGESYHFNGKSYKGGFKYGFKCGFGEQQCREAYKYARQFENDKKHGQGEIWYSSGDYYIGQFEFDYKHGKGMMNYENGER